jgi:shikimate 5-dehydrogenase
MIEAAYEHRHIDARYLNCDVAPEALGDAVRGARAPKQASSWALTTACATRPPIARSAS